MIQLDLNRTATAGAVRASVLLLATVFLAAPPVSAHVPYLEEADYSPESPFEIPRPVEKSRAFYSWLETGADIDVYAFEVTRPIRLYAQAIVPVCQGYEDLLPWFAAVGPGLAIPEVELPFELPPGYGAWVVENEEPWTPREVFYEPFGDKWYFDGPVLDEEVSTPGTWYLYYWNPHGTGGDYVAIVGAEEIWTPSDIRRAIVYTPMIRNGEELHIDCLVCPYIDDRVLTDDDEDGVGDLCDNCPDVANPEQTDQDEDQHGEACDCNDADPQIHPGRIDVPGDGVDSNCFPEGCPGGPVPRGTKCDVCFIATAAFGTEMAGKIDVLRSFRDRCLLTNGPGRSFVEGYYQYSPPLASFIRSEEWLRRAARILLSPLIGFASLWV